MVREGNVGIKAGLILFAVGSLTLPALPVRGQNPPAQPGEIKAVARISKKLIEEVASGVEVTAAIPYEAVVVGFRCRGVATGRGKLAVEMTTAQGDAIFIVASHGTGETCVRGVHGPIVAIGPAWGPFASWTWVRFGGKKFALVETLPWAEVHGKLERVEGPHGGCVGNAVGTLLVPVGQLLIPRAEKQAKPIAEALLLNFVNELAEKIISKLNNTSSAMEKTLTRLYPEAKDWVFQMSSDANFLQAAYGPPNSVVPALPASPGKLKEVAMELWLHTTTKEAKDLAQMINRPLAKQLAQRYLESIMPELAALAEERSVDAVGSWLVISVGMPKAIVKERLERRVGERVGGIGGGLQK
jgi:hypothetical protein